MRAIVAWTDRVPERDGVKNCVYDIAFKPDGTQLVAAVGSRVLVYDAVNGDLLHSLKGHKDTLYCVAYSRDGKRFASGGADKTIIIWTSKAEGILKYSHNDSIQCLSYNSVTQQLASATASDFGLWSPEQKSVAKHKLQSRVLCMSWTNDGTMLTLGLFNGQVSLRDKSGVEKHLIERSAPIWSLQWNPSRDESHELLAVACWDQTLSFYESNGQQYGKDKALGFDPCCVRHFSNGEYICLGGSDRKASLWTKDGVRLVTIAEREDWVWTCVPRPNANYVVVGSNDGTICMYQLMFSTVHGLYREKYAYRDYMTDVVVQHMLTEQKLRIKCKDYVRKIAIYKDRLAVQLPNRLNIYDLPTDEAGEMSFRARERLPLTVECNSLVLTAQHFLLCHEKKLQLYGFTGAREREWLLESVIRYIKVVGGPAGREGVVVGLEDGQTCRIFIDNPFPIKLVKHPLSIRCLDLSASRDKLAVVDDSSIVTVYDLKSGAALFEEPNASSVAWNTELDDMLCFSGNGMLSIKTGAFPLHQQRQQGFVVGFKGSKIFCLHYVAMQTVDVPQSASLYRYLDKKDFAAAHRVACLGVTDEDWRQLAEEALKSLDLDVARKAFVRLKDTKYLELLGRIETERRQPQHDDTVLMATVLAHMGKFQEAAKMFCKANRVERAIGMYSDLRRWDEARQYAHNASSEHAAELVRRQAAWAEEVNDLDVASDTYLAAGDYMKAINILGEQKKLDKLAEVAKSLNKGQHNAELQACLKFFQKHKSHAHAREMLLKVGDIQGLLALNLEYDMWSDALELLKQHPEYAPQVYLPYAQWLAEHDRFEEAQDAFKKAGRGEQSLRMLSTLTHNAVVEHRFHDAAHYLHLLSVEKLRVAGEKAPPTAAALRDFEASRRTAEQYYAYASVQKYTDEPFTALTPEAVFNISRYLLSWLLRDEAPFGISKTYCIFALAKQAKALQANKLARFALEKLTQYKVPSSWQEQVDLFALAIRSRPFTDAEELLPSCFRCQTTNPLLNQAGDRCTACAHPFIRSFSSFEPLPLVRFVPERRISQEEALSLLRRAPPPKQPRKQEATPANPWGGNDGPDVQTLSLAGDVEHLESHMDIDDPFTKAMLDFDSDAGTHGHFRPTMADRQMLLSMEQSDVYVIQWPNSKLPWEFYRNMLPDVPIVLCHSCNHFFHEEDWELALMQKGACPFCHTAVDVTKVGNGGLAYFPEDTQPPPVRQGDAEALSFD